MKDLAEAIRERDALRADLAQIKREQFASHERCNAAYQERDALTAEVAALRARVAELWKHHTAWTVRNAMLAAAPSAPQGEPK